MKYLQVFEKFKESIIDKDDLVSKIKSEFSSIEDAKEEVDIYIDTLMSLNKKGGKVYRLVWLKGKDKLKKNLGVHWVMDIGVFDRFYDGIKHEEDGYKPYLIIGKIEPGQIDIESSISQFTQLPQENEVNLKSQPMKFKIKKWSEKL